MVLNDDDPTIRATAAHDFFLSMPLPGFIVDRNRGLYLANQALAETFGYKTPREAEESLKDFQFLTTHFEDSILAKMYEMLAQEGRLDNWLVPGRALDGREMALEITARADLFSPRGPTRAIKAFLVKPGNIRDAEVFLRQARDEAELAARAKNEFLANINHELRTPLNIIIGMLSLVLEDEAADDELKDNLTLAKEAADGLFNILNDLITLSNLEARRLAPDPGPFSPDLLLQTLLQQFSAQAQAKRISLKIEGDERRRTVLDGGYNLIVMAMGKLTHNAIKFTGTGGKVLIRALVMETEDGPQLHCVIADNGPGLDEFFLKTPELFYQGDGSMNRRHGGLGLGLRLTSKLVSTLGGHLRLNNRDGGGAEISFQVPVKYSDLDCGQ